MFLCCARAFLTTRGLIRSNDDGCVILSYVFSCPIFSSKPLNRCVVGFGFQRRPPPQLRRPRIKFRMLVEASTSPDERVAVLIHPWIRSCRSEDLPIVCLKGNDICLYCYTELGHSINTIYALIGFHLAITCQLNQPPENCRKNISDSDYSSFVPNPSQGGYQEKTSESAGATGPPISRFCSSASFRPDGKRHLLVPLAGSSYPSGTQAPCQEAQEQSFYLRNRR